MSMALYSTIAERAKLLENTRSELSLAIEGRYTNLRIWVHDKIVYMRLDKANAYSSPLDEESANRLDRPNAAINKLLKYGFKSPIQLLPEILEITKGMPYRQLIEW